MGEREMILIARILAALAALFGIVLGLGFLIDPIKSGANFFLSPNGIPEWQCCVPTCAPFS